jgi:hypothetical protein
VRVISEKGADETSRQLQTAVDTLAGEQGRERLPRIMGVNYVTNICNLVTNVDLSVISGLIPTLTALKSRKSNLVK